MKYLCRLVICLSFVLASCSTVVAGLNFHVEVRHSYSPKSPRLGSGIALGQLVLPVHRGFQLVDQTYQPTLITFQVIDKATGKPLPGIEISSIDPNAGTVVTSKSGRFVDWAMGSGAVEIIIKPQQGYGGAVKVVTVVVGGTPKLDGGQIALEKVVTVFGDVTTADGKPALGVKLGSGFVEAKPKPGGGPNEFELDGVSPGKAYFGVFESSGWRLVGADTFEVAPAGQPEPLLHVVVVKISQISISGRILTVNGKAVDGLHLQIPLERKADGMTYMATAKAVTGADGTFSASVAEGNVPTGIKLSDETYSVQTAGSPAQQGMAWVFSDTTVNAVDNVVSGRVLDAHGQPVAGALVTDLHNTEIGDEPVVTDAAGNFKLDNLPDGEVTLLAASGGAFGSVTASTGTQLDLTLADSATLTDEETAGLEAKVAAGGIRDLLPFWPVEGEDKLLNFALRADGAAGADGTIDYSKIHGGTDLYLNELADRDPSRAAREGLALFEKSPELADNIETRFHLWRAVAQQGDAATKGKVQAQLTALTDSKFPGEPDIPYRDAKLWYQSAVVFEMLGDPTADDCLAQGAKQWARSAQPTPVGQIGPGGEISQAGQVGPALPPSQPEERVPDIQDLGRVLGYGGLGLLKRATGDWPPVDKFNACFGASETLPRTHPEQVQDFITQYQTLQADPAVAADDVAIPTSKTPYRPTSLQLLQSSMTEIWNTVAESDPDLVLEKAQTDDSMSTICMGILKRALNQNDIPRARTALAYLLKNAFQPQQVSSGMYQMGAIAQDKSGYFAALIRPIDPDWSDQWFDGYRKELPKTAQTHIPFPTAQFVYYDASHDTARYRLLLEEAWALQLDPVTHALLPGPRDIGFRPPVMKPGLSGPQPPPPGFFERLNLPRPADIAVAMTAFDPHRAMEMFNALPRRSFTTTGALARIYIALTVDSKAHPAQTVFGR